MDSRQFYNLAVRMRKAQKAYEKLPSTYNRVTKCQHEEQMDKEIERVESIKQEQADNQNLKILYDDKSFHSL